jgi:hypothetical protein
LGSVQEEVQSLLEHNRKKQIKHVTDLNLRKIGFKEIPPMILLTTSLVVRLFPPFPLFFPLTFPSSLLSSIL